MRPETKEILDGVLYPWLLERTREEVTVAGQAAGWPVTPVNEPAELLVADHLHQRGFWVHVADEALGSFLLPGAPYRLTEGGWTLRRTAPRLGQREPPTRTGDVQSPAPPVGVRDPDLPPLRNIRVLDLTTVWSGPYLTALLGDLGAEVIRVETPHVFPPTTKGYVPRPATDLALGALARLYGPLAPGREDRPYNRHAMNNALACGKRSCTLDVRFPDQRELFMRLVAKSDVFVENLKSTTLHQMGIHETELLAANPRLIVLRLPPAGLSGDWAHYTGFGGQFDGLTGLAALLGHRGTSLMESPSTQHMDSVTGPAGGFATLAALHYRAATGRGQVIELSQSENVLTELGDVFVNLQLGVRTTTVRQPRPPPRAPGVYLCADGRWLALTVNDDDAWHGLTDRARTCRPRQRRAPRRVAGRHAAHDELDDTIGAWATSVTADAAFHALQQAGVAAAPCTDDATLASDPQIAARQWIRPLTSLDVGTFNHLGHAFRGIPMAWERGAPTLGQDNEYVFKEILGLDDDQYHRLVTEHVATNDYYDRDGNPDRDVMDGRSGGRKAEDPRRDDVLLDLRRAAHHALRAAVEVHLQPGVVGVEDGRRFADREGGVPDGLLDRGHEQLVDRSVGAVRDPVEPLRQPAAYVEPQHLRLDVGATERRDLVGPEAIRLRAHRRLELLHQLAVPRHVSELRRFAFVAHDRHRQAPSLARLADHVDRRYPCAVELHLPELAGDPVDHLERPLPGCPAGAWARRTPRDPCASACRDRCGPGAGTIRRRRSSSSRSCARR